VSILRVSSSESVGKKFEYICPFTSLQSGKVGLLDADIYGPAPTMLGLDSAQIMVRQGTQGEVLEPAFNHGVKLVSMGFFMTAISR